MFNMEITNSCASVPQQRATLWPVQFICIDSFSVRPR
jgi:hypothetical protein